MILVLEIVISVLFFLNKIYILLGKRTGWLLGTIGSILAITYFFVLGLYVYTVLEFGLIALMVYGIVRNTRNTSVEWVIRAITILTMAGVGYLAYRGTITLLELVSSIAVLIGTYLLVTKQKYGWLLYIVFHLCAIYISLQVHQYIFMLFQILSLPIAIYAILKTKISSTT